jgi:hypothetical protein
MFSTARPPTALRPTALTVSLRFTPRRLNAMFNLAVPEKVMDKLIDLADYDGDGQINFAEFARLVTADDITNLKQIVTKHIRERHIIYFTGFIAPKHNLGSL